MLNVFLNKMSNFCSIHHLITPVFSLCLERWWWRWRKDSNLLDQPHLLPARVRQEGRRRSLFSVLRIRSESRTLYLKQKEISTFLLRHVLDNIKSLLFCFHTFDVRRSNDVLDPENQSGSGKIRTSKVWTQKRSL